MTIALLQMRDKPLLRREKTRKTLYSFFTTELQLDKQKMKLFSYVVWCRVVTVTSHASARPHFPALCTGYSYMHCDWLISIGVRQCVRLDCSSVPVILKFSCFTSKEYISLLSIEQLPCYLGMRDTRTVKIT